MAANLTSKKQSDLRVARLRPQGQQRPAVPPADSSGWGGDAMPSPELIEQARALVARFGDVTDGLDGRLHGAATPRVADVVPMFDLPRLDVDGETSLIDAKGRFACTAARTLLGWEPQDLTARREGHWIVLAPTGRLTATRFTPRFNASDKVTLPIAQRRLLGVEPGRKVYVQPVPDADALALLNPAAVLLGAPLSILSGEEPR